MVRLWLLFLLSFALTVTTPLMAIPPPMSATFTASTVANNPQPLFQQGITLYEAEHFWIFRDCRGATRYSVQVSLNLS